MVNKDGIPFGSATDRERRLYGRGRDMSDREVALRRKLVRALQAMCRQRPDLTIGEIVDALQWLTAPYERLPRNGAGATAAMLNEIMGGHRG